MQKRLPVSAGPSSNTWPRCPPQLAQLTSVRTMPWLLSTSSLTFSRLAGSQKLGQPVPESNLALASNSSAPQAAHR